MTKHSIEEKLLPTKQKKQTYYLENRKYCPTFASLLRNKSDMVVVVQLVRASDCGSECRGFESHQPPQQRECKQCYSLYFLYTT